MTHFTSLLAGVAIGMSSAAVVLTQGPPPTPAPEAVTHSPHLYSVKLENDRVRVLEYTLPPGQTEPMHSHGAFVVRFLNDARIRATPPGGSPTESSVERGDVGWREPLAHTVQNIGQTPVEAFIVDVKPCAK